MYHTIMGRNQSDKGSKLLTSFKIAAKFKNTNFTGFPDGWAPYPKRKGDFFYDGGIPVSRGFSNNYFDDLRFFMSQHEESLR